MTKTNETRPVHEPRLVRRGAFMVRGGAAEDAIIPDGWWRCPHCSTVSTLDEFCACMIPCTAEDFLLPVGERVEVRGQHAAAFTLRGVVEMVDEGYSARYVVRLENGNPIICRREDVRPVGGWPERVSL